MSKPGARGIVVWGVILGLAGCAVLGAVSWLAWPVSAPAPSAAPAATPSVAALPAVVAPVAPASAPVVTAPTSEPTDVAAVAPRFDVVRVTPQGDAVVAGRAAPGAEVTLRDNGAAIGTATADSQGQFVIVPPKPIPAGAGALSLGVRGAGGGETASVAPVLVVVPPPAVAVTPRGLPAAAVPPGPVPPAAVLAPSPAPAAPIVVLTSPTAPPRLLQGQAPAARVSVDVVDYDNGGDIRFAGRAPAGRIVRLYVDNAAVGEAAADAAGGWGLRPAAGVAEGAHMLRADALDEAGRVVARVELPFQRAPVRLAAAVAAPVAGAAAMPAAAQVTVQPGQNLWRIARGAYGQGGRYTDIFDANRGQIRDPNLIYPGQVFALPGTMPSAASTSR